MPDITQMPISQTLSDGQYLFGITGTDGVRVPASALNTWKSTTDAITSNVTALNTNLNELKFGTDRGGKNLFDKNNTTTINGYIANNTVTANDYARIVVFPCKANTKYSATKSKGARFAFGYNSSYVTSGAIDYSTTSNTLTTNANSKYLYIWVYNSNIDSGLSLNDILDTLQIEYGEPTSYEPFIPNSVLSLNRINNDIEFLGWSVPSECPIQNYKDADGNYHQLVGRIDLGDLTWTKVVDGVFYSNGISTLLKSDNTKIGTFCNTLTSVLSTTQQNMPDKSNMRYNSQIWVKYLECTDASAFKSAMNGVYLYYELATPITHNVGAEVVSELNNSLAGLTFSVSGDILSITNGTKTWTLS